MAFSYDAKIFSIGRNNRIFLWGIDALFGNKMKPTPTLMQSEHANKGHVTCIAIGPDNRHIFSGEGIKSFFTTLPRIVFIFTK